MKEEGRAEELTRAIEDLLHGRNPGELQDRGLNELLKMARIRWDAARSAAHAGAQLEGAVWQQVLARLGRLQEKHADRPGSGWLAGASSKAADDPQAVDIKELQGVIHVRRQMAERAFALAEAHREAIWQQVQARIQARPRRRGLLSFLPRPQPAANMLASAVDSLVLGEPIWEADNSRMEDLLDLARSRRAMGQTAAAAASQRFQGRLWARLRPRLLIQLLGPHQMRSAAFQHAHHRWPRLAAAGATLALFVAALGPIPATGFADHPIAQFVRFAGEHVGVSETASPPSVPASGQVLPATDVTLDQAGELLGLPVRQPTFLPVGFQPVSSKFFPQPLTANEGGVFLLAYQAAPTPTAADPPTILIYQEHASGIDIAVQPGSALDLALSDGTSATYVQGGWSASASGIVWGADGSQTLVFQRGGLRTIINYMNGPRMEPSDLLAIAEGMAPAPST